jgi:hypothetical protein
VKAFRETGRWGPEVPTRTQQLGLILLLVALTIYVFLRVG